MTFLIIHSFEAVVRCIAAHETHQVIHQNVFLFISPFAERTHWKIVHFQ